MNRRGRRILALGLTGFTVTLVGLIIWLLFDRQPVWILVMAGGSAALFASYVLAIGGFLWEEYRLRRLRKEIDETRNARNAS